MDSISPLLDPSVRAILERRADQVPVAHQRIYTLRMEVRKTVLRFYVNGRFVDELAIDPSEGQPYIELRGHVNLLSVRAYEVKGVAERFTPLPLDDFFNARGPEPGDALPAAAGQFGTVEGIPFVRSEGAQGANNLDLEPSVYMHRMGNMLPAIRVRRCIPRR